ncbi:hypothetical protein BKP35_10960 [Anaerobacillus arseniciselenatis]|uniref:FeS cluster biogenesis domain-containing protein n=1 Tax=Anaerobacillus arseniciselenatis TaxID=85682 RepID=A0A1S2LLK2_9BACI|nr:hypothetical protein [Anaerobacillus arseniciselenatis]OIJ12315.1 hypothetical protein BKP35_10960 [Anaerobacillus arseniciselenatis]
MLLEISQNAANFYKNEFSLQGNEAIRLFVRGAEGFFLGVEKDLLEEEAHVIEVNGVKFFITENDQWHFEGKKLDFDAKSEQMILS